MVRQVLRLAVAVLAQLDSEEAEQSSNHEDRPKRPIVTRKPEQQRVSSWRPDGDGDWLFVEHVSE
ncbi:MAG: hypothetical protein VYE40_12120 [Myxococcota bacterium]|jgi:hypothetical protein|nr:hypothetical protein [Myxococcota bacterium]